MTCGSLHQFGSKIKSFAGHDHQKYKNLIIVNSDLAGLCLAPDPEMCSNSLVSLLPFVRAPCLNLSNAYVSVILVYLRRVESQHQFKFAYRSYKLFPKLEIKTSEFFKLLCHDGTPQRSAN